MTTRGPSGRGELFFGAALAIVAASAANPAAAQGAACPAGTTISGACANPVLVQSMAQRALVFSQPRISFLGLPLASRNNGYVDAIRDRETPAIGVSRPVPGTATPPLPAGTFVGLPSGIDPARLQIGAPYDVVPGGIRIR